MYRAGPVWWREAWGTADRRKKNGPLVLYRLNATSRAQDVAAWAILIGSEVRAAGNSSGRLLG